MTSMQTGKRLVRSALSLKDVIPTPSTLQKLSVNNVIDKSSHRLLQSPKCKSERREDVRDSNCKETSWPIQYYDDYWIIRVIIGVII